MLNALGSSAFRFVHNNFLVYSTCWEDPRVDIEAMQLDESSRILVITSAGCNALDYALEGPESIDAVDINFRQTALLELKLASISELNWNDFFSIFGKGKHSRIAEQYRDCLRARLSDVSQKFWDKHISIFNERLPFHFRTTSGWFALWFRRYVKSYLRLGAALEDLVNAESIDHQKEIYESRIRRKLWTPALGWALRRDTLLALSAIPPEQRRRILNEHPDLLSFFRSKAEQIIYNQSLRDNYFWRVYVTGEFSVDCCPRYLMPHHFEALKAGLARRIGAHTNSVAGYLELAEKPYTHYVLLDHMDWAAGSDTEMLRSEWKGIVRTAMPEALVIWRSFCESSEFVDATQVQTKNSWRRVGDILEYDRAKANNLQKRERVNPYASLNIARLNSAG